MTGITECLFDWRRMGEGYDRGGGERICLQPATELVEAGTAGLEEDTWYCRRHAQWLKEQKGDQSSDPGATGTKQL